VNRLWKGDVVVSAWEPSARSPEAPAAVVLRALVPGNSSELNNSAGATMDLAFFDGMPNDVLVVEDDPIIAIDFEDTILGFGAKTVRTASSVAKALDMIADRPPDFALLDVGLVREKSFAIAERLDALEIPFAFVTGYGVDVRLPPALADKPRLPKPYSTDELKAVLRRSVQ
jgi:CheY-like chemotaxis protein